mgnify:CR=1 FL=1
MSPQIPRLRANVISQQPSFACKMCQFSHYKLMWSEILINRRKMNLVCSFHHTHKTPAQLNCYHKTYIRSKPCKGWQVFPHSLQRLSAELRAKDVRYSLSKHPSVTHKTKPSRLSIIVPVIHCISPKLAYEIKQYAS